MNGQKVSEKKCCSILIIEELVAQEIFGRKQIKSQNLEDNGFRLKHVASFVSYVRLKYVATIAKLYLNDVYLSTQYDTKRESEEVIIIS